MARSVGRKRSQRGSPRSKTLERYPEYMEFVERSRRKSGIVVPPVDEVASPEERLVLAHAGMQDHIAAEVLDHLIVLHGVGVSVTGVLTISRVDNDFFDEVD
jgi:restriction endonuclease Mrr